MNLQGDKTGRRHIVKQMSHGHAIYPSANRRPYRLNPQPIPLADVKSFRAVFIAGNRVEPSAARFIVDAARPFSGTGVQFQLITVDTSVHVRCMGVAAKLHAGIQTAIDLCLEFEDKV